MTRNEGDVRTFKDSGGRQWSIEIDYATIKRVRGRLDGFDLLKLIEDKMQPLADLLQDPIRFIDTLYVLCQAECKERGVSDEDFGRSLAGDALAEAAEAFVGALTDFFPQSQRRALAAALAKGKDVGKILVDRGLLEIEQIDAAAEADRMIAEWKRKSPQRESTS